MHILSAKELDKEFIRDLFYLTSRMKRYVKPHQDKKIIATIFHEPSTRTRLSFEAAICRLGGKYISVENAKESSSHVKGESIEDSIRTVSNYVDAIVLRHPQIGAAEVAAKYSSVPVINAGDGAGEHPTQALIDLYTIWERRNGMLSNLVVTILGSGRARTINSVIHLLEKFNIPIQEINSFEAKDMDKVRNCNVLYMTRIQSERFEKGEEKPLPVSLQKEVLDSMKKDAMILHPLPRQEELPMDVDDDPRAAYWEQVNNGLYLRMALLNTILYHTK